MMTLAPKRPGSRPLDGTRALQAARELAEAARQAIALAPQDFENAIRLTETVVARYRSACLALPSSEAEGAIRHHDRAFEEMNREFTPIYYRLGVLENIATRYERIAAQMMRALA
jgi:hypothetical protein